jgi:hypothetical protein
MLKKLRAARLSEKAAEKPASGIGRNFSPGITAAKSIRFLAPGTCSLLLSLEIRLDDYPACSGQPVN